MHTFARIHHTTTIPTGLRGALRTLPRTRFSCARFKNAHAARICISRALPHTFAFLSFFLWHFCRHFCRAFCWIIIFFIFRATFTTFTAHALFAFTFSARTTFALFARFGHHRINILPHRVLFINNVHFAAFCHHHTHAFLPPRHFAFAAHTLLRAVCFAFAPLKRAPLPLFRARTFSPHHLHLHLFTHSPFTHARITYLLPPLLPPTHQFIVGATRARMPLCARALLPLPTHLRTRAHAHILHAARTTFPHTGLRLRFAHAFCTFHFSPFTLLHTFLCFYPALRHRPLLLYLYRLHAPFHPFYLFFVHAASTLYLYFTACLYTHAPFHICYHHLPTDLPGSTTRSSAYTRTLPHLRSTEFPPRPPFPPLAGFRLRAPLPLPLPSTHPTRTLHFAFTFARCPTPTARFAFTHACPARRSHPTGSHTLPVGSHRVYRPFPGSFRARHAHAHARFPVPRAFAFTARHAFTRACPARSFGAWFAHATLPCCPPYLALAFAVRLPYLTVAFLPACPTCLPVVTYLPAPVYPRSPVLPTYLPSSVEFHETQP